MSFGARDSCLLFSNGRTILTSCPKVYSLCSMVVSLASCSSGPGNILESLPLIGNVEISCTACCTAPGHTV